MGHNGSPCQFTVYYCEQAPPQVLITPGEYEFSQETARLARAQGIEQETSQGPCWNEAAWQDHVQHALTGRIGWAAAPYLKDELLGFIPADQQQRHFAQAWSCVAMSDLSAAIRLSMPYDRLGGFVWELPPPNGKLICRFCQGQIRLALLQLPKLKSCGDYVPPPPTTVYNTSPQSEVKTGALVSLPTAADGLLSSTPAVMGASAAPPSAIRAETKLLTPEEARALGMV